MSGRSINDRQGERLKSGDFDALSRVFHGFNNQGIGYYNCGINAGCTEPHKHLQYIPSNIAPMLDAIIFEKKVPFICYSTKLDNYDSINLQFQLKTYFQLHLVF